MNYRVPATRDAQALETGLLLMRAQSAGKESEK